MKKWIYIGVGFLLSQVGGQAFQAPEQDVLPDFDSRRSTAITVMAREAVTRLKARLPETRVELDERSGQPFFVSRANGFLTGADGEGGAVSAAAARAVPAGDPHRTVKAFLNDHQELFRHDASALAAGKVLRDYATAHNGMRTVVWQQEVDGLPVFEALLSANLTKRGELITISSRFVSAKARPNRQQPLFPVATAILHAGKSVDEVAGVEGTPKLLWLPVEATTLRLCWEVMLIRKQGGELYRLVVDAETGQIWVRQCLTHYLSNASYRVYTSDSPTPFSPGWSFPTNGQPPAVSRTLVVTNAVSTNASPNGWINDGNNTTTGNNVDAYLDKDGDNAADPGSRPAGSPFRVFDFPLSLAQEPVTYTNAAVVQLFYMNNWVHDRLYELGFTEAAGNFQTTNFGRGGLASDAVRAEAQDGKDTDNANFSTPGDGSPPRMQMYIFTGATVDHDGDLDAEVVIHEYCHGLSQRLIGNGGGLGAMQSAGMGEGWSDFYALSLLSQPGDNLNGCYALGTYATHGIYWTNNYYFGIRRYPYSTDLSKSPLTFKDIDPAQASQHAGIPKNPTSPIGASQPHNMGEVWCVTLWEARARLITRLGFAAGNQTMLQLVTDAMKLTPANPNFIQARDAIILADQVNNDGANLNDLWSAFAKRGLGQGAFSPASSTTVGLYEGYGVPGFASGGSSMTVENCDPANYAMDPGETVTVSLGLNNTGFLPCSNVVATLLPTGGVTAPGASQSYGTLTNGGAIVARPFTFVAGGVCGGLLTATLSIQTNGVQWGTVSYEFGLGATTMITSQSFDGVVVPALPAGWTAAGGGGMSAWATTTSIRDSLPNSAFVSFPASVGSNALVSPVIAITSSKAKMIFRNRYLSEERFDGGVLEVKIGSGSFQDILAAGGSFMGNGYNNTLSAITGNPLGGRAAWTGDSGGFFTSSVLLPPSAEGQNIQFRWRAGSDSSIGTGGWYVDGIYVFQPTCCGNAAAPPQIVKSGSVLTNESCSAKNGALDPGESVQVSLTLQNIGGDATNVTATLLAGSGVIPISGPQAYGTMTAGDGSITRLFNFSTYGDCGSAADAVFQVQAGATVLGRFTNSYYLGITVTNTTSFTNAATLTIPGSGTGSPSGEPASSYPSSINVSGMKGNLTRVSVTLLNLAHTYATDLDVLLVSPSGRSILLLSDVSTGADFTNVTVTLDDEGKAFSNLPMTAGVYRPTDLVAASDDVFPAPANTNLIVTTLAECAGFNPNGTWSLFVVDDQPGDTGLLKGWALSFTTVSNSCCSGSANQPPAVTSATILPAVPNTTQTLTASASGTDPNADAITFAYQWQTSTNNVLFVNLASQTNNTLAAALTAAGNYYRYIVTPSDWLAAGAPFTNTSVFVLVDSDNDGLNDDWEVTHFNTLAAQTGAGDPDLDGFGNAQEFIAGTNPNDAASLLRITQVQLLMPDTLITFTTATGKTYAVEQRGNLINGIWNVTTNGMPGTGNPVTAPHAGGATNGTSQFYRVRVNP